MRCLVAGSAHPNFCGTTEGMRATKYSDNQPRPRCIWCESSSDGSHLEEVPDERDLEQDGLHEACPQEGGSPREAQAFLSSGSPTTDQSDLQWRGPSAYLSIAVACWHRRAARTSRGACRRGQPAFEENAVVYLSALIKVCMFGLTVRAHVLLRR